jgi:uncharacterized damage-inducible protein DinB
MPTEGSSGMSDGWVEPADDPRTYGNPEGEKATLREYLSNYRLTLDMKCAGLDAEQLARRSVPPSTLSLLGLIRHLAQVENHWFQRVLQARTDQPRLFKSDDDRDEDFNGAIADAAVVEEAFDRWRSEIAAADDWLDVLDEADLSHVVPFGEDSVSVRDVLVHVVEEYARHAGHADLLRECIDGRTGQ